MLSYLVTFSLVAHIIYLNILITICRSLRFVQYICICVRVQVKVKLSLCLTNHHATKAYWERRYSSTHSLTSALDGGEWSASLPGSFTPTERAPGTHLIGVWVSPRTVLDAVVKRKIPSPRRKSNPRTPIVQPVAQRYTD
jgi:hypothetical protein